MTTVDGGVEALIDADAWWSRSPDEGWWLRADAVEPSSFAGTVAVVALIDLARPAAAEISRPPARIGTSKSVSGPSVGGSRVLEDAAIGTNGIQSRFEAAVVVSHAKPGLDGGSTKPVAAPAGAGGMSDDGPRASVEAGVSFFIPGIDVREVVVDAVPLHEERCDHPAPSSCG